ncbi:kynurenine formamidase isoform X4 [Phyllopteryx taeniolatus]|uniref:kynurenine formamidase isoform X4 n=1 Tax=Phyllopteryx taeniolatus TaxID=161469 RepID=UPI002AD33B5B|nr:kynurenine formamidase isoform X4 [Phyllopteryx taeniolatus]
MLSWTAMTKDELERQYSPSRWSHRMAADDVIKAHVKALKEGTDRARGLAQTLLNVPYGEGEGERLDAYIPTTNSLDVPLVIYFHGGYWQFLSGLYLCGHSAGAHLAAMILSTDWSQYSSMPQIKGAFLVSGIYDLLPILSTYVNKPLKMTEEVAIRNSPSKLIPQLKLSSSSCLIVVAVAENDSPEFRKQSEDYYNTLKATGLNVTLEDVPNTDHFSIIEQLIDGDYHLTKLLLKMMGKS